MENENTKKTVHNIGVNVEQIYEWVNEMHHHLKTMDEKIDKMMMFFEEVTKKRWTVLEAV